MRSKEQTVFSPQNVYHFTVLEINSIDANGDTRMLYITQDRLKFAKL